MFDVLRLDDVVCTTALEVKLLAALVTERRLRTRRVEAPPDSKPKWRVQEPAPEPEPKLEVYGPPRPRGWRPASSARLSDIVAEVAKRWDVSVTDIRSARRTAEVVVPRHVAILLCRTLTQMSHPQIGRAIGGRDHTTTLHASTRYNWLRLELIECLSPSDPLGMWVRKAFELCAQTRDCPHLAGDNAPERVLNWPFGG
jgi:hypothetical protein